MSRFVIAAAIAAFVLMGGTAAWADCPVSPNYVSNFNSDQGCLSQNGNSAFFPQEGPTVLRLTPDQGSQDGSAWFSTQQAVQGGFSTTFQFRFTQSGDTHTPADGIAFVIQSSSTTALGAGGGSIGYADGGGTCPTVDGSAPCDVGGGIRNSLAIEFDTYNNGTATGDPNNNHIAVQSCGIGQTNSPAHTTINDYNFPNCLIGSVASLQTPIMSDQNPHTAVISYTPPTCTGQGCSGVLTVILDGSTVLTTQLTLENYLSLATGGKAWVGFTSATGAAFENHDILSWTFTPQAQSGTVGTDTPSVLSFNGGAFNGNTGFDYNAILTGEGTTSATVQVQPILITEAACEKLVDANKTFGHAKCFVFQNADGHGTRSSVLFELTCPDESGASCDQSDFYAVLGTDFVFQKSDNLGFQLLNSTIGPYPGWLKGDGGVTGHPCQVDPNNPSPLFHSNQILSFTVTGDPTGTTKGGARPGGSCWTVTYLTGGELPPGVQITAPTLKTYSLSSTPGQASYTCSDPKTSQGLGSPVGPYLTAQTCTQSQVPNKNNSSCSATNNGGVISCTGTFDLSVKGVHLFTVTSKDSGGNVGANIVLYNVK
ncbi:MAG: L-type lectin-domain containing protein [Terriglobales bacterium]